MIEERETKGLRVGAGAAIPSNVTETMSAAVLCHRTQPHPTRKPRCFECGKVLAEVAAAPWLIQCPRCKAYSSS